MPRVAANRRPLPGWAIDLATNGVRGDALTRAEVVKAARRLMLSAHRNGWTWPDVHALLTDTHRYRIAAQIAAGCGGRTIDVRTREKFLTRHWSETADLAERPAWNRSDALGFIQVVQDALNGADLNDQDRAVLQVVLDLANQHGTSRPTVPVRVVAERTGMSKSAVQRRLARLATEGDWLTLAQRGDRLRASLFTLAPALAATYRGASPPESHHVPMSHVPTSHREGAKMTDQPAVTLTRDQIVRLLGEAAWAQIEAGVATYDDAPPTSTSGLATRDQRLRVVSAGEATA